MTTILDRAIWHNQVNERDITAGLVPLLGSQTSNWRKVSSCSVATSGKRLADKLKETTGKLLDQASKMVRVESPVAHTSDSQLAVMLSHLLGAKRGGHIAFSRALPLSPKEPSHRLHTSLPSWSEYLLASGLFPSFSCTLCNKSCCERASQVKRTFWSWVNSFKRRLMISRIQLRYTLVMWGRLHSWLAELNLSLLSDQLQYMISYTHIFCMYKENWKATTCRELNPGLSSDYLATTTRQLPAFVCL